MQVNTIAKKRTQYPRLEMPKKCFGCKEVKSSAEYYAAPGMKDGLNARCRDCLAIKDRQPKNRFSSGRARCRSRGHMFHLKYEEWLPLISQPCFYCEGPLNPTGIGLDRKDHEGAYEAGNVVQCCGVCNSVRIKVFTFEEMIEMGKVIKKLRLAREAAGAEPLHSSIYKYYKWEELKDQRRTRKLKET